MHTEHAVESPINGLLPCNDMNSCANDSQALRKCWRTWCRLCAKDDLHGNINVFFKDEQQPTVSVSCATGSSVDLSLVTAIEKYFWVQITRDDDDVLPKMLCTECFSLVTSLVNFSERVAKVQQMFGALQCNDNVDLHAMRLKYGLLDEEREHVLMQQQPVPEVHFFEAKPKINELELEEKLFEVDVACSINPLEQQPRIKIKIKKESITEEARAEMHENVVDETGENEVEEIEPFTDTANGINNNACIDNDNENDDDDDYVDDNDMDNEHNNEEAMSDDDEFVSHNRVTTSEDDATRPQTIAKTVVHKEIQMPKSKQRERRKRKHKPLIKEPVDYSDSDADASATKEPNKSKANEFYRCSECPRKFKRAQHYSFHMKRTHAKEAIMPKVTCTECVRSFTTQLQLERHRKTHLPLALKKIVPCPYCDKKFSSNTLVQTHIKYVHMNERPFICEECGIAVRTNAALKTHMLTHTDYAPYECEVCKKGFKNKTRLKNHMETHDPNKHICAECGLQLNSRSTLNNHLLVHSDVMQHKCDYCGRAFKRAKTLKTHLILHTGLKPYSCDFCVRTFANASNFRAHKKKAHPEELAALKTVGGGQRYTFNIPKLEALKELTKAADNLVPVVSKQSGCFAYGKKTKTLLKETTQNSTEQSKKQQSTKIADEGAVNVAPVPTIGNNYNHIMQ